ncbi:MAG: helix-turn-helix transcriptional regulator [Alphaproteobacteria bacterium]|nr:helix-turn-helix transcriptional regulator [Alphaproteobacteria bacterium]MDD9919754.1 helix-turn-helix transcriptional regulator [Alphaproteobacteria bacterium]
MNTPKWLEVLKQQVEVSSQAAVARKLGISPSALNQVLKGTYKASSINIEVAVRSVYMGDTIACPILDEIPVTACLAYQKKPFNASNHLKARLFKACRTCPHNKENQDA